jgi:flagellar biosynthesis protein FlhG
MNDQAKKLRELAQRIREEREKANLLIDPLNTVPERIKLSQNIIPKTTEPPLHESIIEDGDGVSKNKTVVDSVKRMRVERYIEPTAKKQPMDRPERVRITEKETPPLIQTPAIVSPENILFDQPSIKSFGTRVVAVSSGKGGVGKSNVVANLGIALAMRGRRVMILDADLGMANIDVIFGINPKFNLKHLLDGEKRLDEIVISGPHSIKIVPGGSGVPELANLSDNQQQKLIESFIELERTADITFIDTGAGISKDVISFILAAREALIITTPEPTAITDAYGLIKVLTQRDLNVDTKVVVNMVSSEKEGREIADRIVMAAKQFLNKKVEPLGYILADPSVYASVRQQVPFVLGYPNAKASRCIGNLAASIDRIPNDDQRVASRNGFKGFLSRLFEK